MLNQGSAELAAFVVGGANQWARAHQKWPEWASVSTVAIAGLALTIYCGLDPYSLFQREWRGAWGQVVYTIVIGLGGTQAISSLASMLSKAGVPASPAVPVTNSLPKP